MGRQQMDPQHLRADEQELSCQCDDAVMVLYKVVKNVMMVMRLLEMDAQLLVV